MFAFTSLQKHTLPNHIPAVCGQCSYVVLLSCVAAKCAGVEQQWTNGLAKGTLIILRLAYERIELQKLKLTTKACRQTNFCLQRKCSLFATRNVLL